MSIGSEPDPHSGSPVGVKVDATPARRPGPMVLEGRFGRVEKLDAARRGATLRRCSVGAGPLLFSLSVHFWAPPQCSLCGGMQRR